MVLSFVGLGLGDVEDITLKGYKIIKEADVVYLEIYTSLLIESKIDELESFYNKKINEACRITIEEDNHKILHEAQSKNVVILISGDPFSATTHTDLYYKAIEMGLDVNVVHNASIMSSIGICGLQLYRFGETVSIPFFDNNWYPDSFYDKIINNLKLNLHTLCLLGILSPITKLIFPTLDIKVKERSVENLMKDRMIFEPSRFMSVNVALEQLRIINNKRNELDFDDTICIGIARLGSSTQYIKSGTINQLFNIDFGPPLHSLIICSKLLHELEDKFIKLFK